MSKVHATYSGFVGLDGVPVLLNDGDEYDDGHPLVQARPDLFTEPPTRRQQRQAAAEKAAPADKKATNG